MNRRKFLAIGVIGSFATSASALYAAALAAKSAPQLPPVLNPEIPPTIACTTSVSVPADLTLEELGRVIAEFGPIDQGVIDDFKRIRFQPMPPPDLEPLEVKFADAHSRYLLHFQTRVGRSASSSQESGHLAHGRRAAICAPDLSDRPAQLLRSET